MHYVLKDRRLAALATALLCFAVVLFAPGIFADGDTYWHISAGRWMLDNHAVLRIDPFSYSFAGRPWQTHEWLSEIVVALAYVGLGWNGVAFLFAAVVGLASGLLSWHLSKILSGLTLFTVIVLSVALLSTSMLARPHVLALLPLELWVAGLVLARRESRAPHWALLPMMTLWANIHGSFLFGLALLAPFALEVAMTDGVRSKPFRGWVCFGVLAGGAALLTPFGIDTVLFPLKLTAMPQLYTIVEWMPSKLSGLRPLPLSVGGALFVLLYRGVKIPPLRLCILLGLLYMTLLQARHQMLLGIVAPLLLAEPLARALDNRPQPARYSRRTWPVFLALFAVLAGGRFVWPISDILDTPLTPSAALARVSPALLRAPVLNDYGFGGYLIFRDIKPFIDGRAELYGQDFLQMYERIWDGDDAVLATTLAKYRIRWTIFSANSRALPALDRLKGWHRLYADKKAVIHVKDGS